MLTWITSISCIIIFIAQCDAITDEKLLDKFYPDDYEPEFVTKCFGDLGCFYTGPPFYDPVQRPEPVAPESDIDAKFYLFTPDNPYEMYELVTTTDSLKKSKFNERYPLKVLIHGSVQKKLSLFFKETFLESQDIHIIAHSLGSHLAGWVGKRIEKLGRISGIDPSGPNMHDSPIIWLDSSDAIFVDVLHANGGLNVFEGLALIEPIGQVNFYPNGGQKQPGCNSDQSKETLADFLDSCSHERALVLYIATINSSECQYFAVECDSWEKFKEGACQPRNSTINKMGFHAKYIPGVPFGSKFYLKTGAEYPFCNQ